jgi:hypothetical protein
MRNLFFRGNHGHTDTYLSVGSPDQADMKKRPPGDHPRGRLPISSSMSKSIHQTARKVNKNSINNTLHDRTFNNISPLAMSPQGHAKVELVAAAR